MSIHQHTATVSTPGRGLHDITAVVAAVAREAGFAVGVATVFLRHTSASLVIQENADPDVLLDLEDWMARAVQDGDPRYRHSMEGPDDMPAHIRGALTASSLTIPVSRGALNLGVWQGIYLYEHRFGPHRREVVITVMGES